MQLLLMKMLPAEYLRRHVSPLLICTTNCQSMVRAGREPTWRLSQI